ncbi:uncharacterized protein FOBCDRAFT_254135 [Fusarium oxysporum Fo47]|nr:uncharacterized protein FOBCDRAFT_254135 [Fusarium oxysporum Fo47]WJG37158.1 hypothetical protein FOBCDRAFT_254135 [Fusarium oxysporum Fo47]
MSSIKSVAIIGCGAIGASWAALFIAQGLQVKAFDINPAAETYLRNFIRDALPVLSSIGLVKNTEAKPEDVVFTTSLEQALRDVDFVQENGPERIDFKRRLFQQMGEKLGPDVIIATSSSGLTCSSIQEGMTAAAHPQRCVVGHPFNPPHLIPLVEVVGGSQTSPATIETTMTFYTSLGKKPIHLQKEVPGHVANRIQAAVMREVFHILQQDVCSVQDVDDAVSYGPGLRWGVMGPNMLFHLGGGEGGIEHFADHLLGPLQGWYAKENPVVDEDLREKWIEGTKGAVGARGYGGLVKQRDEELVRLLNVPSIIHPSTLYSIIMGSLSLPRLYILDTDLSNFPNPKGRILSCYIDGSDLRTVHDQMKTMPDGITIDHQNGFMYWTNMGSTFKSNDGSIERSRLDGSERTTVVSTGTVGVYTPKQITLARQSRKLYWCDREGMKVMRCNLDGSDVEVLVSTGSSVEDRKDMCRWCVGITVDESMGYFYWSQKGPSKGSQGRIFRAKIDNPTQVETVIDKLPEPIDLEFDESTQTLYWTDRGDPPYGNSLNRAFIGDLSAAPEREVLARRLHETIGLALDKNTATAYVTDLSGGVYAVDLKKKTKTVLFPELGDLTGIALA